MKRLSAVLLCLCTLAACSDKPDKPPYPGVKIGQPYQIYGRWYKPKYEPDYDEIGMASWYGPGFHGEKTANGERYDQNDMSAAHRTLPLPSIVRVTNLENGKSVILKVNDRGPFARNRIIDLSKAAATTLGVIGKGTAKVRVQFLEQQSREYVENSNSKGIHYAMDQLKSVEPAMASSVQENRSSPKFYVMKVPKDQPPPPASIVVSEAEASQYPTRNIFDPVDKEHTAPMEQASYKPSSEAQLTPPAAEQDTPAAAARKDTFLTSDGFFIQAGTFGQKKNAHSLVSRLSAYKAKVVDMSYGNRKLYRVLVGPYEQASTAKNMLSKLASLGIADARIIRD